ncbi:glycerophosphodiester phosphodiesterase GDPDL6-like isoform X1 [Cucurbita pepo subsp. pepo]|uniref:glycerophosphodiester phosphodiesterase GDPDL6-like isoform X1 n=1 Tax=Cucurbita pepo subsp. pepo TaxID=3664 RepID=UPI000C9D3EE9|nr:glycerophosphodiester phosphodiesterase GDPDL6-like isoform X1 [Cucurbita pepo subsp. pepo]
MLKCLFVIASLVLSSAFAQKQSPLKDPNEEWHTLTGEEPIVVARGGFSGVFPESSALANEVAVSNGLPNTVLYCNLQLTKDGLAICLSDILLENSTNIEQVFPKSRKTYEINGKVYKGWFSVDFMSDILFTKVALVQGIMSRPSVYDGVWPISAVDDILGLKRPVWLNAEWETFYQEHNLSIISFVKKALRLMPIDFVSSSEIGIVKGLGGAVDSAKTRLIFRFLGATETEPTTGKQYGDLLHELAMIKTIASGIAVPKSYIWPVSREEYVLPATTVVMDAHNLGLEVYAHGFANDAVVGYNYSYDPVREYLPFIDNGKFAVDGLITDYIPTASEAIACYVSFRNPTKSKIVRQEPLVISSNGASGDYPGSTDLAYEAAIEDGSDVIDCSVQISKDGVPFCMETSDLLPTTTAITAFNDKTTAVPELQQDPGIFSFDLTWPQILTLKPQITNPFLSSSGLVRNPAFKNKGKFMSLSDFLEFAKARGVRGIMINLQNAAFLAAKKGLDMVGIVSTTMSDAHMEKESTLDVYIRSDDTSVLTAFKTNFPTFIRVLTVDGKYGEVPKKVADEIKIYADAVAVPRSALVEITNYFTVRNTGVVAQLKSADLSVFVYVIRNEYVSLAFDYYSQASLEISTYVDFFHVDGVITDFPYTAKRYITCPCRPVNTDSSGYSILPPEVGTLLGLVPQEVQPRVDPPSPPLDVKAIVDPPLPPVSNVSTTGPSVPATADAVPNISNFFLSLLSVVVLTFHAHSIL